MAHRPHLDMPIRCSSLASKIGLVARSGYRDICTDPDASVLLPSGSVKTLDCVCLSLHGIGSSVFSEDDSGEKIKLFVPKRGNCDIH